MKPIKKYIIEPKYRRDNGLYVIDTADLPFPQGFAVHDTSIVHLPSGQIAGNHKHPRQEAYYCCDKGVELHWLDDAGKTHIEVMSAADGAPTLFVMPPFVPHAVVNASTQDATLVGFADGPLDGVEMVEVAVLPQKSTLAGLSEPEAAQVASQLSRLEPGFLPFAIFHEVTRLVVTPIVEVVPLRLAANGKTEILLLKREVDDPVWPHQLHIPGTVVRASDAPGSFNDPLQRILAKELSGVKTSEPAFVKNILHHSGRGMEASQIFWVEVQSGVTKGEFYDADDLSESIVKSQLDFIPDAITHFKKTRAISTK
jgi:uncharacterized RmlC-like cupin family protein